MKQALTSCEDTPKETSMEQAIQTGGYMEERTERKYDSINPNLERYKG